MVSIKSFSVSNNSPFFLIAGPCQIESKEHAFEMAGKIKAICCDLNINWVYKSSFDKANRTSAKTDRGIGIEKGLMILKDVGEYFDVPTITDIHESYQAQIAADFVDVLQIPAFLCRQTDLLKAAAKTKLPINVKKGQFLAPWDMKNVVDKIKYFGNDNVLVCERGTSFGYNTLVSDFRGLPIMSEYAPVVFDATHSVQQPGGKGGSSGGQREFVEYLAKAAVAVGIAGLFLEVHEDPDNAPSDGPNMLNIKDLKPLLEKLQKIDNIIKN